MPQKWLHTTDSFAAKLHFYDVHVLIQKSAVTAENNVNNIVPQFTTSQIANLCVYGHQKVE